MKQAMTAEEKYKMMMDTPINRLIPRLAVPTIISMLITSIYNMADTFFGIIRLLSPGALYI